MGAGEGLILDFRFLVLIFWSSFWFWRRVWPQPLDAGVGGPQARAG